MLGAPEIYGRLPKLLHGRDCGNLVPPSPILIRPSPRERQCVEDASRTRGDTLPRLSGQMGTHCPHLSVKVSLRDRRALRLIRLSTDDSLMPRKRAHSSGVHTSSMASNKFLRNPCNPGRRNIFSALGQSSFMYSTILTNSSNGTGMVAFGGSYSSKSSLTGIGMKGASCFARSGSSPSSLVSYPFSRLHH